MWKKSILKPLMKQLLKKNGDYLLGCVNYYYINFGYFKERQAIFDQLPEYLQNSPSGKMAFKYLAQTKLCF